MPSNFTPRLNKPEAGNKYYLRRANGGYSDAIEGNPKDKDCNVLSNCVGYAFGRFNEIGGWGSCKYLAPVNAAEFMKYKGTLKSGLEPQVGACMVWSNGGAGHVAIVERVVNSSEVVTSESEWGGRAFYTATRKKGNGNWGYGGSFLGFIYNPADCCQPSESKDDIKVGDTVEFTGNTHYLNPNAKSGSDCKSGRATVTAIEKGKKHPYHLIGEQFTEKKEGSTVWGWVNEADIRIIKTLNIPDFIAAAVSDGFILGWNETLDEFSAKCLVQEWKDGKSRYPALTRLAQRLLGISQTGICDFHTTKAIKEYQKNNGLTPDGGIGRKTWTLLLNKN